MTDSARAPSDHYTPNRNHLLTRLNLAQTIITMLLKAKTKYFRQITLVPLFIILCFCAAHGKTLSSIANSKYCDFFDEMQGGQAIELALPISRKPICVNSGDLSNNQRDCRGARIHHPLMYRIFIGRVYGRYRCAYVTSKKWGASQGWILSDTIKTIPIKKRYKLTSWVGNWREVDGEDIISIKTINHKVAATGKAVYPSYNPPKKYFPGGASFGNFNGYAIPDRNTAIFGKKSACLVYMRLLGSTLVVNDNNDCGGDDVTFRGVYARQG